MYCRVWSGWYWLDDIFLGGVSKVRSTFGQSLAKLPDLRTPFSHLSMDLFFLLTASELQVASEAVSDVLVYNFTQPSKIKIAAPRVILNEIYVWFSVS